MTRKHFFRSAFWIGVYFAVAIAPLIAMLVGSVPPGRGFWREFSVGIGFAGLSMMGLQFFLTGRFQNITAPYGIDVVYHFHRAISMIAFFFIFLHAAIILISTPETLILLIPAKAPWWLLVGIFGFLAFATVIATSLYRIRFKLSYEKWRIIHGYISVLAVVLGMAHIEGVGYYVQGYLKRGLWVTLAISWIFALLYVRIIKPLMMLKQPYRIEEVRRERGNSWTLILRPDGHKGMDFKPGQFAWLTIGCSPYSIREHPFSFSSSSMDTRNLKFTIKELGDFTSKIGEIAPGTIAYIDGPHGTFSIDTHVAPGYVFIVGGVGITPIMSILRTMADRQDMRPVLLIYASKTWEGTIFREEIEEFKKHLNLKAVYVLENPHEGWDGESGWVTAELMARYLPENRMDIYYFICGPAPMQKAVKISLQKLGLPMENVQSESFNFV